MNGLGRNVRFMMGIFQKEMVSCFLFLLISWTIFWNKQVSLPVFIPIIYMVGVLVTALIGSDVYCSMMVSLGSARKPAAIGMILSQYLFLVEQFVILFLLAVLLESSWMQVMRSCSMGVIAVLLILQGVGLVIVTLNMRGYVVWAIVLMFTLIAICIVAVAVVMLGVYNDFVWSVEMLKPYNHPLILWVGIVVDLLGAYFYYKVVTKVDLKLA